MPEHREPVRRPSHEPRRRDELVLEVEHAEVHGVVVEDVRLDAVRVVLGGQELAFVAVHLVAQAVARLEEVGLVVELERPEYGLLERRRGVGGGDDHRDHRRLKL